MYRKYNTSKTSIINSHNYLLQAQYKITQEVALFHQVLINNQLAPLLLNQHHLQTYIGESQNQNVVSESSEGFETYFDGNLIQIKIKNGFRLLSDINTLDFSKIIEMIIALNLDYALAIKQIIANSQHKQRTSLNNCCKFYQKLINKEGTHETVLPFIEIECNKIHYYDIYFGSVLPKHIDTSNKQEFGCSKGLNTFGKKIKLKNGLVIPAHFNPNSFVSEEVSFKRYVFFLLNLFTVEEPQQRIQSLQLAFTEIKIQQQIKLCLQRAKNNRESAVTSFIQLLDRCLNKPQEYNIHIFQKQCELLQDKYHKLKDKTNIYENKNSNKKASLLQEKQKISKSMIVPQNNKFFQNRVKEEDNRLQPKRNSGRLRYSKSEITLNKSIEQPSLSHGRKLKKATLNIFKNSKIQPSNSFSTLFIHTSKSYQNTKKINQGSFGQRDESFHFSKMCFSSNNWQNFSTMKEPQAKAKLRNFKKTHHLTPSPLSPSKKEVQKKQSFNNNTSKKEEIVDRFSHSKGVLMKKQQKSDKFTTQKKIRQDSQDKFTMTQETKQSQFQQIGSKKNLIENKSIVSTLNIKLFKQPSPKIQAKSVVYSQEKYESPLEAMQKNEEQKEIVNTNQSPKQTKRMQSKQSKLKGEQKDIENKIANLSKYVDFTESKMMASKVIQKVSHNKYSTFQNVQNLLKDQIEEVSFTKTNQNKRSLIQRSSYQQQNQSIKSRAPTQLVQEQKKINSPQKYQKPINYISSQSKKTGKIMAESQKILYKKHFQLILTFFKQHLSKINTTPHISNVVYLINILYYKNMIETIKSESNAKYKQLTDLISKKQERIPQEMKKIYLIFRVRAEEMYQTSKKLIEVQSLLNKGMSVQTVQRQFDISLFLQITEQACMLLDEILAQLYNYIQINKAMLISKDSFGTLLQLCYLVSVVRILCGQRLKYYKILKQGRFQNIFNAFSFQFKKSEDEYFLQYQKKISEKDMAYLNVLQEFNQMKVWIDRYS